MLKAKLHEGSLDENSTILYLKIGRVGSVDIATRYWLGRSGTESRCVGARFSAPVSRSSLGAYTELLYNEYRIFHWGLKRQGRGADHPLPIFSTDVIKGVVLYLYSPSVDCYIENNYLLPKFA
jgi:hypothetical protein